MTHATHRTQPASGRFWLLLTAWIVILGLVLAAGIGLWHIYHSEQILAGVQALGRELGGKSPDEAAEELRSEWTARRITLQAGEWHENLSLEQAGIMIEAGQMARTAQGLGRAADNPENLWPVIRRLAATSGLVRLDVESLSVPVAWRFDRDAAARTLRTLAGQIDVPVKNAGVRVVEGRVETTPASAGRALDIAAMLAQLETYPWAAALADPAAAPPRFELPIAPQLPAISDVSALAAELQPLLARPITLHLYDAISDERTTWSAPPTELGNWLTFAISGTIASSSNLIWSVDANAVAAFVDEQNASFVDGRYVDSGVVAPVLAEAFQAQQADVHLQIRHREREHIVQTGETLSSIAFDYGMPYPWIQDANPGVGDALFAGDRLRIPSADALLPLPVVESKRIVVSLTEQRVWVYENGQLIWNWPASTGIASSPTSPGVFQVQSHDELAYAGVWDLYMPWFMGIYRVAPDQEFMNGFHGFPSRDRKQFLWERNLGSRITYGCILISTTNAKLLYDWAEEGVVVEIRR